MTSDRVVVLTALNVEYEAVRERIADPQVHWHPAGTRFETGRFGGGRAVVGLVGKGNHTAAVLAERAISEFDPAAVLFVGVAGALKSRIRLGDVVIASHVYAYHGGTSEDDGLKTRPRAWETSHRAAQIVQQVIRTHDPRAHFGPIAAGEIVLNSRLSDHAQRIRERYNDALAIEMEAAGVAQAGHHNDSLPVVVIRGISDRADGTKTVTDRQNWQRRAVTHAAEFAALLVPQLVEGATPAPRGAATYSNVATGNARVGIQAGQLNGDVTFGRQDLA